MITFSQKILKPWGYEIIFSNFQAPVTSKVEHVNKGARNSLQYHETKEEILTLIKGKAKIIFGQDKNNLKEEEMKLLKGYLIPKGLIHRFEGITEADIFESSTTEEGTTIRLEDDYNRGNETSQTRKKREEGKVYLG